MQSGRSDVRRRPSARRVFGLVVARGTDGDGWFVIGAAVAAGVMLYLYLRRRSRRMLVPAVLAAAVGVAVSLYDRSEIGELVSSTEVEDVTLVQAGWGIDLAVAASISLLSSLVLLALLPAVRLQTGSRDSATEQPPPPRTGEPVIR